MRTTVTKAPENKPRVVLADDQAATLALSSGCCEPSSTSWRRSATDRRWSMPSARVSPDAIVTDISMPVLDGIEATREILGRNPSARVCS